MRPGDDAAYAVLPRPGVQVVRRGGVDLRKQQRGRPAPHCVAGGVAALAAQFRLLAGEHLLVEHFEGPAAVIVGLGRNTHLVRRGQAVHQHGPNGRGGLLGKGQAKRHLQFTEQGFIGPDGVPLGHLGARGVRPLGLAPLVLHHVVREPVGKGVRRRGEALDQVRKLFCREIDFLGTA